jgi:inorganic pyrophosphatase
MDTLFWERLDQLVMTCELVIDRPQGTPHPHYPDFIYPFDYGYLKGALAMDQGGIDVWLGSLPERRVCAIVCTVDLTKKDTEIKILIGCTPAEAERILQTHNSGPQSAIFIPRP